MCQLVKMAAKAWNGIRSQYPRDFVNPPGMKNDVNSMRSMERNEHYYTAASFCISAQHSCLQQKRKTASNERGKYWYTLQDEYKWETLIIVTLFFLIQVQQRT